MVINADGTYIFVPALNFNGLVPAATYTLSDGNGGFVTATLSITVTPVDDAPILVDDHASGNEDTTITGNVLPNDSDPDGDTLFVTGFTVNGDPTPYLPGQTATIVGVGTITIEANGSFTFVPEPNYDGPVPNIVYTASDGKGGSGQANLIITINPVDDFVPTPDDNVPDFPAGPDSALNTIDADGAVLDAVDQIRGLNGIAEFVERPIEVPLRLTLAPFLGGSSTIVLEDPDGGSERIHVETIKRAGIVYLQIVDEPTNGGEPTVLSYRLRASDGSGAVEWLSQIGPLSFAGHPDAEAGTVDIILSIVQRDGRVSDHELQLDTATGHLSQPTALGDRSFNDTIAPTFSQQLSEASRTERLDRLDRALGLR